MVIIFCGIPGCGKTVRAKKLAQRLKKLGSVRLFISDELRPPVYRKFFQLLQENLGKADFLIFDGTFYKKAWRDKLLRLVNPPSPRLRRASREKVILVYVHCSLRTALKRNRKRPSKIPERAVHIIFNQMERPTRPNILINSEELSINQSVEKIIKFIK